MEPLQKVLIEEVNKTRLIAVIGGIFIMWGMIGIVYYNNESNAILKTALQLLYAGMYDIGVLFYFIIWDKNSKINILLWIFFALLSYISFYLLQIDMRFFIGAIFAAFLFYIFYKIAFTFYFEAVLFLCGVYFFYHAIAPFTDNLYLSALVIMVFYAFVVNEPHLINVAVSRAIKKFILVSDVDIFRKGKGDINALIRYIDYYEEDSVLYHSDVRSVFDLLYSDYKEVLNKKRKDKRWKKSKYDSENLMCELIENILAEQEY